MALPNDDQRIARAPRRAGRAGGQWHVIGLQSDARAARRECVFAPITDAASPSDRAEMGGSGSAAPDHQPHRRDRLWRGQQAASAALARS